MNLYLDAADAEQIREVARYGLVDGVTTNPTLVAATDQPYRDVVATAAEHVDGPVFVQVTAEDVDGMVRQAAAYDDWADDVVVKIPATKAGFEALGRVRSRGVQAGITVLFSVTQAMLAAKNDATFVAPYVGRLDDAGEDGVDVTRAIQEAFDAYGFETEVLAASIRNRRQATTLYRAGVDAITLSHELFEDHVAHHKTTEGVAGFRDDWADRGDPVDEGQ